MKELNVFPTFLKHSCKQCNSPLKHQFHNVGNILDFFAIQCHYFQPTTVIFWPVFNFTLITRHNIMACDLESHAIAIKL